MSAPFLTQRQQVALKVEGTEGTDSSPADADVIAPVYGVDWTPTFKMNERHPEQASFSSLVNVAGTRHAVIKFETELKGSSSAGTAPFFSAALQSCGWSVSISTGAGTPVTLKPNSGCATPVPSCTVEVREGEGGTAFKRKFITGARGKVTMDAVTGDTVKLKFEFTGKYNEPTETTALTSPALGVTPVPFLSAALSFLSVPTLKVHQLTFDPGVTVAIREDANQAGGVSSAVITNRKPTGTIDPEQDLISVLNMPNKLTENTQGTLTFALTGATGNIVTFTAPKVQIANIAEADRSGVRTEKLTLHFGENAAAGDDEVSIVIT